MRAHSRLTPEAGDRAALYGLGGMPDDDVSHFERHLEICGTCREEVSSLRSVVSDLLLAAPEADPSPGLRDRVLARVRQTPFTFLPAAERAWLASGNPGVEICQLWLDQENERHTILIRMGPGSSLPKHRHGGPEECYVVQGDLESAKLRMRAGDYVRFEAGSTHFLSTQHGCLLFVTASLHDEIAQPTPPAG